MSLHKASVGEGTRVTSFLSISMSCTWESCSPRNWRLTFACHADRQKGNHTRRLTERFILVLTGSFQSNPCQISQTTKMIPSVDQHSTCGRNAPNLQQVPLFDLNEQSFSSHPPVFSSPHPVLHVSKTSADLSSCDEETAVYKTLLLRK